jgi:hypothetical protein
MNTLENGKVSLAFSSFFLHESLTHMNGKEPSIFDITTRMASPAGAQPFLAPIIKNQLSYHSLTGA